MIICGGVIFGYCEIGNTAMAKSPSKTRTIDTTPAKRGLSIKNFENFCFYPSVEEEILIFIFVFLSMVEMLSITKNSVLENLLSTT